VTEQEDRRRLANMTIEEILASSSGPPQRGMGRPRSGRSSSRNQPALHEPKREPAEATAPRPEHQPEDEYRPLRMHDVVYLGDHGSGWRGLGSGTW
jgi:hypothetical protein